MLTLTPSLPATNAAYPAPAQSSADSPVMNFYLSGQSDPAPPLTHSFFSIMNPILLHGPHTSSSPSPPPTVRQQVASPPTSQGRRLKSKSFISIPFPSCLEWSQPPVSSPPVFSGTLHVPSPACPTLSSLLDHTCHRFKAFENGSP